MKVVAREVSEAFDRIAEEYDRWYEGNPLFESELKALKAVSAGGPGSLEIGVGSGRFAEALGISFGLDPAFQPLRIAARRGIHVVQGLAQQLPFKDMVMSQVFFILSLCFIDDKERALQEAVRVLEPGGRITIGFIPKDSPWGQFYCKKARAGHAIYRYASFVTAAELLSLLDREGLTVDRRASTLVASPGRPPRRPEEPLPALDHQCGFVAVSAVKT